MKLPPTLVLRQRSQFRRDRGLSIDGQALIGDYRRCGLTHQQYRTAQKHLASWGLAAFKPTSRGTVATLLDHRIYDINDTPAQQTNNKQTTNEQQTANN